MTIYQDIWDADQAGNGIKALRMADADQKDPTEGYVLVDETVERNPDQQLFPEVVIPAPKLETYELCVKLFDNYAFDPATWERSSSRERIEERAFISEILTTEPMKVAQQILSQDLGQKITDDKLAELVKRTWFQQGQSGGNMASGFEHVFIGEQKLEGDRPDSQAVELGGYHFWYKYYLDDGGQLGDKKFRDRIRYGGTKYDGTGSWQNARNQGLQVPEVVTLSHQQQVEDLAAGGTQKAYKPIGGFWVGCSPEGLMALGLVRVWSKASRTARINGATYDVKFFPLDNDPKSIRSFFPIFKRADFRAIQRNTAASKATARATERAPLQPESKTQTPTQTEVKIIAAMVNPAGRDAGNETFTLQNVGTGEVNLNDWQLETPNGDKLTFADVILKKGDRRRFRIGGDKSKFRNRAGTISLWNAENQLQDQVNYTDAQAKKSGVEINFTQ